MSPLHFGPPYTPRELALLHDQARRQAHALRQQAIDDSWRLAGRGLRRAWRWLRQPLGTATPCARPVLER